ncbi:AI-2E family transporter [Paracoccus suum]|uniref:AI-2E family transporter n=1 Tax=Paracoccus suum TaxID=2259340 RepID=A0A344PJV5_9RHOB|nr:AI-2E family transporter [Paracoccus suum]AXC49660.1 AI-2E family transporter [Paracoccus suum]
MLLMIRRNTLIAAVLLICAFLLLSRLGGVLVPFVLGIAIAYFLDPVADRLQRAGLSRVWATALITLVAFAVLGMAFVVLIPTLIAQLTQLVNATPATVNAAIALLTDQFPHMMEPGGFLNRTLIDLSEKFRLTTLRLLTGTLRSVVSVISTVFVFIITPTVAIYMLYDWDRMVAAVDRRLPRDRAPLIRRLALDIDGVLSGFVRGQFIVGLLLATFYGVTLMALGLKYALIIAILAGVLNFIPWLGSFVAFGIALGVATVQFWGNWWHIAVVGLVFVFGQVVEGNVITPRIVGDSVKLHPVWLLVSLAVFGSLFGFAGLLLAVPIAASLGVVVRWLDDRWLASPTFRGEGPPPDKAG